ncbi:hypothetical protein ISX56_30315, partial [Serratia ureilytica]|nr:hypothetical protein [Serratia ureilytica]
MARNRPTAAFAGRAKRSASVPPAYGMIAGALAGGLCGGADLVQTVTLMIGGAQGITNAVMRILAAGVLAGVLIESGAAHTIAETIVRKVGET